GARAARWSRRASSASRRRPASPPAAAPRASARARRRQASVAPCSCTPTTMLPRPARLPGRESDHAWASPLASRARPLVARPRSVLPQPGKPPEQPAAARYAGPLLSTGVHMKSTTTLSLGRLAAVLSLVAAARLEAQVRPGVFGYQ